MSTRSERHCEDLHIRQEVEQFPPALEGLSERLEFPAQFVDPGLEVDAIGIGERDARRWDRSNLPRQIVPGPSARTGETATKKKNIVSKRRHVMGGPSLTRVPSLLSHGREFLSGPDLTGDHRAATRDRYPVVVRKRGASELDGYLTTLSRRSGSGQRRRNKTRGDMLQGLRDWRQCQCCRPHLDFPIPCLAKQITHDRRQPNTVIRRANIFVDPHPEKVEGEFGTMVWSMTSTLAG